MTRPSPSNPPAYVDKDVVAQPAALESSLTHLTRALAPLTVEQELRARILDLERDRDQWKADAAMYRQRAADLLADCAHKARELADLKAALARRALGMDLP